MEHVDTDVLGGCETHDIASEEIGDVVRVFVGRCCRDDDVDVPAVFVLDGNGTFGMAVDIVRHLQLGGHLPPMLVVGVGYAVPTLRDTTDRRWRDLTPTQHEVRTLADGPAVPTGGGPSFARCLVGEVVPWVRAHRSIGRTTLVGHSLGGLFAATMLLDHPDVFDDYVLVSPSVWWDDEQILGAAPPDRLPPGTRVIVAVGDQESADGRIAAASVLPAFARGALVDPARDIVVGARALADLLVGDGVGDGVGAPTVWVDVLVDGHHVSVIAPAISRSLRVLFGAPGHDRLMVRWPPGV